MARPKQNPTVATNSPPTPRKKLSLGEFRAWLSGVEEMQDEEWTPSASQWRTIRAKIEEVIDAPAPQRNRYDEDYDERPRGPVRAAGPSAFGAGHSGTMQAPSTALNVETNLVAVPNDGSGGNIRSGGLKVKTPNIDTSKQPYVAAFE